MGAAKFDFPANRKQGVMTTRIALWGALALCLSAGSAWGQAKIGYVDFARLLDEAPQKEVALQRLNKEFAPRDESLRKSQKELAQLEEDLRRNAGTLPEGELRQKERDLRDRQREMKRVSDEFRDDLSFRKNDELGKLQQLIKEHVEALGKQEQYDLVLFQGVVYASDKFDMTDKILERLRQEAAKAGTAEPGKPAARNGIGK